MIFPPSVQFNEPEKLILKIILSGVSIESLNGLFQNHGDQLTYYIDRLKFRMLNPFTDNLEKHLFEYSEISTQKHIAVKRTDYEEAARLRHKERDYLDIGSELIFKDHNENYLTRKYIRYETGELVTQLNNLFDKSTFYN